MRVKKLSCKYWVILKINIIPNTKINNRKTKGQSEKKTPACLEWSSWGKIKTVPEIFETSVGDNTKLDNNFDSSSNERKQTSKKSIASDQGLDVLDEVTTKNVPEHYHAFSKDYQETVHNLILCRKRDTIKKNYQIS